MLKRIIAMALIAFGSAVRSRLVLMLFVALALALVALPLTVKGDGTLAGQLRIMLCYTLGLAAIILSVATVWAACGTVSLEVEDRSIHLVAVKPVRRLEIWLGKWLGLMIMNSLLIAVAGMTVWAMVMFKISRDGVTGTDVETARNEILTGRKQLLSVPESFDDEALKRFDILQKADKLPKDEPREHIMRQISRQIALEHSIIPAGTVKKWTFDAPKSSGIKSGAAVSLRVRFFRLSENWGKIAGAWTVGSENNPEAFKTVIEDFPGNTLKITVPVSAVPVDRKIVVAFHNAGSSKSNAVGFDSAGGVEMLFKKSSFQANLARALFVILCYMGFLAALGVTCGSIFSFPVASFVSAAMLAIAALGNYFVYSLSGAGVEHGHSHGESMTVPAAMKFVIERIDDVVEPVLQFSPLTNLADGLLVSWGDAARALLVLVIIYGGVFAAIGGYALRKKELALPD
jgi:hypothetical protein